MKRGTIKDRLCSSSQLFFSEFRECGESSCGFEKQLREGPPATGTKKWIVEFKRKGLEFQENRQLGGSRAIPCGYFIAEKTGKEVKEALGLDALTFGFTGAAPISKETQFFGVLGIQINEVYGMSECAGATTCSIDQAHVWGSCGFTMVRFFSLFVCLLISLYPYIISH